MTATVQANLGFQGSSQFKVNLASNLITTYASNCTECAESPYLATEYFDYSDYKVSSVQTIFPYEGYSIETSSVDDMICLANDGPNEFLCSYDLETIDVITEMDMNYWNTDVPAASGTLGLASLSPIWENVLYCIPPLGITV
jgi:hypothetical protein